MPGVSQVLFVAQHLNEANVSGKRIIDIGSHDFNGSVRPLLCSWGAREYLGVDIIEGKGVDLVCDAKDLVSKCGRERYDIILCLEMLEHAEDWRGCISALKQICVPGGTIVLTTRSLGYPCHGFPHDFWRFEPEDISLIFSDFDIQMIERDPISPGVFLLATKPTQFKELPLSEASVYSIPAGTRLKKLAPSVYRTWYYQRLRIKQWLKKFAGEAFLWSGRVISRTLRL